jgi:hypothetical protein
VLHDRDRHRRRRAQVAQDPLDGGWAPGGGAEDDQLDAGGRLARIGRAGAEVAFAAGGGGTAAVAARAARRQDLVELLDQHLAQCLEVDQRVLLLVDEVGGAAVQGLDGLRCAAAGVGREDQHRQPAARQQGVERPQAADPRHRQVEHDGVGLPFVEALQQLLARRGEADDLERGLAGQEPGQRLADERRVVGDGDAGAAHRPTLR